MAANHTPQRAGERRGAVEQAQRRQRENKLGNAIGVWIALVLLAIPAIGLPIAFLVQWLRWMLRHEVLPIVPTVVFLVAMMALVAASHFLQRHTEGYALGGTISSVASLVGFALILVGALLGVVFQEWLLGTNVMGVGLVVSTIGLAGLAIVTLGAGVLPWWGGVALIAANPFLALIWFSPLGPNLGGIWLVVVSLVVAGFAVVLAARRRTERPARVR